MKNIALLLISSIISICAFSQTPQAFKYQAVVRNGGGEIVANQLVGFEISIHDSIPAGTKVYQETHTVETNDFGLAILEIGNGVSSPGKWETIDWSKNDKFLEVAVDITGGEQYVSMGTTQLLAVPYAMYSESTGDTTRWRKIEDDLYFDQGTVGVGTTSPLNWAKLDVRGNIYVDGYSIINPSDGSDAVLDLYNTVSDWEMVAASDANRFDIRKWGDVPALSILDNYNVGFRNTNPLVDLDIRSNATDIGTSMILGNSDNSSNIFLHSGHETSIPTISFKNNEALRFTFYNGGINELMRIQNNGNVGIGTDIPDESALMELSSNSKGFLLPRLAVTEIAAISNPANGLMVFNTTDSKLYIYIDLFGEWKQIPYGINSISESCGLPFTDSRDQKTYNTVKIGTQCWMAENLNIGTRIDGEFDQYNNGDIEKYCYNNVEDSCDTYGGLYQWDETMQYITVEGVQGICPTGWHIPSDGEWLILEGTVDTQFPVGDPEWDVIGWRGDDAGGNLKEPGYQHWNSPNAGAANISGFTSLGSGVRYASGPIFVNFGIYGAYWSSSIYGGTFTWVRNLINNSSQIERNGTNEPFGLSVRCIKD